MANADTKNLDETFSKTALDAEASLMQKRVGKIQEDIKKRFGPLPTDFDEKAFIDEGWEC